MFVLSKYKPNTIKTKKKIEIRVFFKEQRALIHSPKNERKIVFMLAWKVAIKVCISHFLTEGQVIFSNKIKICQFMHTFYFKLILK